MGKLPISSAKSLVSAVSVSLASYLANCVPPNRYQSKVKYRTMPNPDLSSALSTGIKNAVSNVGTSGKAVFWGIVGFFLFILAIRVWGYFRRGGGPV